MQLLNNHVLQGADGRPFLVDVYQDAAPTDRPVVIFAHGFKGFKDWGYWDLVARAFARNGFLFVKFNFSHNGTTIEQPLEFADLEAFGRNNYSKELTDLAALIEWLKAKPRPLEKVAYRPDRIGLIGHSRGGGIGIVAAAEQPDIAALATWAGVDGLDFLWRDRPELIEQWRDEGVIFIPNARTGQQMPLYFQLYEDWEAQRDRFDLPRRLAALDKSVLIVHGTHDTSVPPAAAEKLHEAAGRSHLVWIKNGDHVFGGKHPWPWQSPPFLAAEAIEHTLEFMKEKLTA